MNTTISIFALGDSAITINLGNIIDERLNDKAILTGERIRNAGIEGIRDILVAYSSVSVFYDPCVVRQAVLIPRIRLICEEAASGTRSASGGQAEITRIPVCYEGEYAPDLPALAESKGLEAGELVRLHYSRLYKVYMIGFLPGFPYMGEVDPMLAAPRKRYPVPVLAGGVGIAGNQTGVYPVDSPGGWQIIGRTPFRLFDPYADEPVRLRPGDVVEFYPVDAATFRELSLVPVSVSFKIINDCGRP